MRVEIDLRKSVAENAAAYYEKAKKAKRKIPGLMGAIERTKKELEREHAKETTNKEVRKKAQRERDWYEAFHWTNTTDGFLVIAGRDAKTNTKLVRNYMDKADFFLHADVQGAAVTIIKSGGRGITEEAKREAAIISASYSKAWSAGRGAVDIYGVKPEQVNTAAGAGEYLAKGSFVILGKREWFKNTELALWISYDAEKNRPFASAKEVKGVRVVPGDMKKGELAKKVKKALDALFDADISLNDLQAVLPAGSGGMSE